MFSVAFDFDYEEFRKRIEHFKRTKTKPYHFTPKQRADIVAACKLMAKASGRVASLSADRTRDYLLGPYFQVSSSAEKNELLRKLRMLDQVIRNPNKTVIFVDGTSRRLRIKMNPDNIDEYPTWLRQPTSNDDMKGVEAWVFPLPGGAKEHGTYHVGSGYRIILGQQWVRVTNRFDRAGTIYHELTHKILGTNDHVYGDKESRSLRKSDAWRNADNYCHFLINYIKSKRIR